MRRTFITIALSSVLVLGASTAHAQDTAHAKEAYDRGVAAHERSDFTSAAREFALADSLAPSPVALQAALDAAVDADDPVIGGELLERSKRLTPPLNPKVAQSIEAARKKLGGRAGRVRVTCPAGTSCTAAIDGRSFDTKNPTWVVTGPHTVVVQLEGDTQSKGVDVKAGEVVEVAPVKKAATAAAPEAPLPAAVPVRAPPPAPPQPRTPDDTTTPRTGLPPWAVLIGAGATVVIGGGAAYFMVQTRSTHDDFVSAGCERGPAAGCNSLKDDGDAQQRTANLALGLSAVLAVATVVIAVGFTDWSGGSKKAALQLHGPVPGTSAGGASYSLRF